jgi:hypothetical protein
MLQLTVVWTGTKVFHAAFESHLTCIYPFPEKIERELVVEHCVYFRFLVWHTWHAWPDLFD